MNPANLKIDPQNPGRHHTWVNGRYRQSPFEYVFLSEVVRDRLSSMVYLAYTNDATELMMSNLSVWGGCTVSQELRDDASRHTGVPLARLADYMENMERPPEHTLELLAKDGVFIRGWEVPIGITTTNLVHQLRRYKW